jgi:hypothetical protein
VGSDALGALSRMPKVNAKPGEYNP